MGEVPLYSEPPRLFSRGRWTLLQVEGHRQSVSSVSYSLDGKYIASGSNDGTCRVLP